MNTYEAIDALKRLPRPLLARVLSQMTSDLRSVGLDPAGADAAALRSAIDALPEVVVQRLVELHLVALDPALLATAARRRGLDLGGGWPIELAARALLDHPEVFGEVAARLSVEPTRTLYDYVGRDVCAPRYDEVAVQQTQHWLAEDFAARGGLRYCQIHRWRDRDRHLFLIKRATARRLEQEVSGDGASTREGWPVGRDLVIADARTLRIGTSVHADRERYRTIFGQLLHGDAGWFTLQPTVRFDPLKRAESALRPTRGLRAVRLVEVCLRDGGESLRLQGDNVAARARGLRPNAVQSAQFALELDGGSTRFVRITAPNGVAYAGWADDPVARGFLEERGFLLRTLVVV